MSDSNGSASSVSVSGGISITTILGVTFIILKLCHVIDWPWVCVCIPFIVDGCLFALAIIFGIIAAVIAAKE